MCKDCVVFQDLSEKEIEWFRFIDEHNFIFIISGSHMVSIGRIDGQFYRYFNVKCVNDNVIKDKVIAREILSVYINGVRYGWE